MNAVGRIEQTTTLVSNRVYIYLWLSSCLFRKSESFTRRCGVARISKSGLPAAQIPLQCHRSFPPLFGVGTGLLRFPFRSVSLISPVPFYLSLGLGLQRIYNSAKPVQCASLTP